MLSWVSDSWLSLASSDKTIEPAIIAKKINNKWIDRGLFLDYLQSHVELEHILMDCKDRHNTEDLTTLDYDSLVDLAIDYDF